ncbi:MAG: hypothetical protein AAB624_04020 [Patescibacteria group bacterium]
MDNGEDRQLYDRPNAEDDFSSTTRQPEHQDPLQTSEVKWTASEFIDHQKSSGWFMTLAGAGILLSIAVYFLTKDVFATVIVAILAFIFGIGAARKPRVLNYSIDEAGIAVGNRHSAFEDFRSFAIVSEGAIESILLLPTKRWAPPLSVYFSPEDGDKIIDTLSAFVPFENHEPGLIDKFLHRIHF